MNQLMTVFIYVLWVITLGGILVITFNGYQYADLNIIVGIILFFTLVNTFFVVKRK